MSLQEDIFNQQLFSCSQRVERLKSSLNRAGKIFPLTLDKLRTLDDQDFDFLDAFILRYSQVTTIIQEQIFRSICLLEEEDDSVMTNRDRSLLMEKIGAIESASMFGDAAKLRNKFAHNYPEETESQIERLNLLPEEAAYIVDVFSGVSQYINNKNLFRMAPE